MESPRDMYPSDMYYPTDMSISELDFDILHDLPCDFNILDDDGIQTPLVKQEYCNSSNSNSGSDLSEICSFEHFSSVDSPPLTPSSVEALQQQVKIENESNNNNNNNNAVLVSPEIISKFPKILPALNAPRGRSASHDSSPDMQALKRHIRMIRNRESASLSRKKKKDYMSGLEVRVKELEVENARLKQENCALKSRLGQLMGSDAMSSAKSLASMLSSSGGKKNSLPSVTAKVALFGLCCFMFISLNKPTLISPTTNSSTPISNHIAGGPASMPRSRPIALTHHNDEAPIFDSPGKHPPSIRARRSILWNDDAESTNNINWNRKNNDTNENMTDDFMFHNNNNNRQNSEPFSNITLAEGPVNNNCPTAFNLTEAMRVQNDLKGIFSRKPRRKTPAKPFVYSLIDVNGNDNKGLAVYDEKMRRFSRVLDQLHRRSDTFYVVSLAVENQLLLSAKSHNASSRPKMSFLMPWKNDTLGGKEEVMQIDCEVTQVFNLNHRKRSKKN